MASKRESQFFETINHRERQNSGGFLDHIHHPDSEDQQIYSKSSWHPPSTESPQKSPRPCHYSHMGRSHRKVPNCISHIKTPELDRHHGGVDDCDSVWGGSVSGSSESSYLDFDSTSLLSGIANLELSSPSYHYARPILR